MAAVSAAVAGCGANAPPASTPFRLAPPRELTPMFAAVGPTDPHDLDLGQLIPRHTRLRQVWFLRGGRSDEQVLVEWVAGKPSLYGDYPDNVRWGLTLWSHARKTNGFATKWRGVAVPLIRVAPASSTLRVAVGDVTNDRHPDVLVEQYPHTNHGCGPHEVVATLRNGRTVRAFRDATLCETTLYGVDGLLALDLPVYDRNDGVCCWRARSASCACAGSAITMSSRPTEPSSADNRR
jgi:hypothetical protein